MYLACGEQAFLTTSLVHNWIIRGLKTTRSMCIALICCVIEMHTSVYLNTPQIQSSHFSTHLSTQTAQNVRLNFPHTRYSSNSTPLSTTFPFPGNLQPLPAHPQVIPQPELTQPTQDPTQTLHFPADSLPQASSPHPVPHMIRGRRLSSTSRPALQER